MLKCVDLNYNWEYCKNFHEMTDDAFETVNLPHTNIELPFNNFSELDYQFESYYRKKVKVDDLGSQRLWIRFEGVMSYAKVYVDKTLVGEHKGGYTPFELEITDFVESNGQHMIGVYVDSREREDIPPFGHVIDYLTFGGIYREVSLIYRSQCFLKDICLKAVDVLDSPKLEISGDLYNLLDTDRQVDLKVKISDGKRFIHRISKAIEASGRTELSKIKLMTDVIDIELWSVDSPALYTVEIAMEEDGLKQDCYREKFGFRRFEFTRNGFYQNGKALKIIGLNRHQSYPYVGYAMPKNVQRKDADILKYDLKVNAVRLSHYPQSKHFLDRCDEIGLLVFNEIPGWQHIGDSKWKEVAIKNVEEMILRDRNRPCIFIWGTRINESNDDHDFYKATGEKARQLDTSRSIGGVRCIKNSELLEDVYTYNDFSHIGTNDGLEAPRKVFKENKPYMVTEFNGHMFPTKKFDDEAHRLEQASRHMKVIDSAYKYHEISGAIGWCMFDYNTHKDFGSGDRVCYHGVMDMFRIPKMASYVYQSQSQDQPVLYVASSMNIGEYAGGYLSQVKVFTNCDYIKVYSNDGFIGDFYPDKTSYPHVKHPGIIIDDFIGNRLHEGEAFNDSESDTIKDLLIKANKSGGHLSWIDKLRLAFILLKHKMSPLDAENLYTKYFGGWGQEARWYRFDGYINNKVVMTVTKGQFASVSLICEVDSRQLLEEATYDATRIVVKLIDEFGQDIPYAHDAFTIETSKHLQVIGPTTLSLVGGSIGFWVKSLGIEGAGKVTIHSPRYGLIRKEIQVRCNHQEGL